MKQFAFRDVRAALAYSRAGGQALHIHRLIPNRKTAPKLFMMAVDAGQDIAHLFDLDAERLIRTAKSLGVKNPRIHRKGDRGQHVDLAGGPLHRAKMIAAYCVAIGEEPGTDASVFCEVGWYAS